MSDLSECCYGMGFGPEGDGVELMSHAAAMQIAQSAAMALHRNRQGMQATRDPRPDSFANIQWPKWLLEDKPEINAKPALPALTRQAGEKYKGPLAFCHADD